MICEAYLCRVDTDNWDGVRQQNQAMNIKLITLNVRGLRGIDGGVPKRRKIFTWLKKQKEDIILLQETHSDEVSGKIWLKEWGGLGFFAYGDNVSRGVAIFFKSGLNTWV